MKARFKRWIIKLVLSEIRKNGVEIGEWTIYDDGDGMTWTG